LTFLKQGRILTPRGLDGQFNHLFRLEVLPARFHPPRFSHSVPDPIDNRKAGAGSERLPGEAEMKRIGRAFLMILVLPGLSVGWSYAQRPTRDSAWDQLLQADPSAADDASIG
jgi:hypothetical protein